MIQPCEPKISFNIEDGVLDCFITGERSNEKALQVWSEILNQCNQHQLSLVQVTMALRGKYQPFNAIEIYRAIIALLLPAKISLAVVDLNHLSSPDSQVACNMGYIKGLNVSYFESQSEAKSWLLKQSKSIQPKAKGSVTKSSSLSQNAQPISNDFKNFA